MKEETRNKLRVLAEKFAEFDRVETLIVQLRGLEPVFRGTPHVDDNVAVGSIGQVLSQAADELERLRSQAKSEAQHDDGELYAVITEDRHTDVVVEVFEDKNEAIAKAKAIYKENLDYLGSTEGDDVGIHDIPAWEFCGVYSCEGDRVRVVRVPFHPGRFDMSAPSRNVESSNKNNE